MLGVLLIAKPGGLTSHDVVNTVRRRLSIKRVGHAGTLDPMATGLLVVAIGPATRFLQFLPLEPKEYVAEIRFGTTTDSYDAEGTVLETRPVPEDLLGAVRAHLDTFRGLIRQVPPMYSAVKVKGKPLYAYARQGTEIERESRSVHIGSWTIEDSGPDWIRARIECSGGTYIRSLAHDLGQAVGCGAHLSALERTRVGRFSLAQAVPLDQVARTDIRSLRDTLPPLPMLDLGDTEVQRIRHGLGILREDAPPSNFVALCGPDGAVIGIGRVRGNQIAPECVIPAEAVFDV